MLSRYPWCWSDPWTLGILWGLEVLLYCSLSLGGKYKCESWDWGPVVLWGERTQATVAPSAQSACCSSAWWRCWNWPRPTPAVYVTATVRLTGRVWRGTAWCSCTAGRRTWPGRSAGDWRPSSRSSSSLGLTQTPPPATLSQSVCSGEKQRVGRLHVYRTIYIYL